MLLTFKFEGSVLATVTYIELSMFHTVYKKVRTRVEKGFDLYCLSTQNIYVIAFKTIYYEVKRRDDVIKEVEIPNVYGCVWQ